MDRHSQLHVGSRVELPSSIRLPEIVNAVDRRYRRLSPLVGLYVGVVGFLSCGVAVIATASLIALHIQ